MTLLTPSELIARVFVGSDERVAVTGATGWFGSVAMDLLYEVLGEAAPSRVTGYASRERDVTVADGRLTRVLPLAELSGQDPGPTTILHFGFLTRDKVAGLGVDAYTSQNAAITSTMLGAVETHRPQRVVVASSGAVRSSTGGYVTDLREDPYGALKRIDELAFQAAVRQVGGTCVIPRVYSVAGPRMTKPELYALGSMIQMAAAGGPVAVRARGPVFRSYCGVDEVIALALWLAFSGREEVFDSGGTVVELGELAQVVAEVHGLGPDAVERSWEPSAPTDRYVGDTRAMDGLASEAGMAIRQLPELVRETAEWLTGVAPPGATP